MPNLLDLMSPEDKAKAIAKAQKRLARKKGLEVSPEMYILAEFGYYFGFEGVMAIKRGYVEYVDLSTNEVIREPFTLEEVITLIEAAKKVWYSKVVDSAHAAMVASAAKYSKDPRAAFEGGMQPFLERAQVGKPKTNSNFYPGDKKQ